MQFVIFRDNGGQFHWRMEGTDGSPLAVSLATFSSADDARRTANEVYAQAATATAPA